MKPTMIRVSEIIPLTVSGMSPLPPRGVDATKSVASFEGSPLFADLRISADLAVASRGLTVAQHAERVLCCLREVADRRP